jgi:acyl carrier protein
MIIETLKNYFKTDPDFKFGPEIDENTSLIESGLLDSFSIVKLVTFLEKTFNIKVEIEDLTEENMDSMKSIEALITRMLKR